MSVEPADLDRVRVELAGKIATSHEKIAPIAQKQAEHGIRLDRLDVDVRENQTAIKATEGALSDVVSSLKTATGHFDGLSEQIKEERVAREAVRASAAAAAAQEEADAKAWRTRWMAAATPQNMTALIVLGSAIAYIVGQLRAGEEIDPAVLSGATEAAIEITAEPEPEPDPGETPVEVSP